MVPRLMGSLIGGLELKLAGKRKLGFTVTAIPFFKWFPTFFKGGSDI